MGEGGRGEAGDARARSVGISLCGRAHPRSARPTLAPRLPPPSTTPAHGRRDARAREGWAGGARGAARCRGRRGHSMRVPARASAAPAPPHPPAPRANASHFPSAVGGARAHLLALCAVVVSGIWMHMPRCPKSRAGVRAFSPAASGVTRVEEARPRPAPARQNPSHQPRACAAFLQHRRRPPARGRGDGAAEGRRPEGRRRDAHCATRATPPSPRAPLPPPPSSVPAADPPVAHTPKAFS